MSGIKFHYFNLREYSVLRVLNQILQFFLWRKS